PARHSFRLQPCDRKCLRRCPVFLLLGQLQALRIFFFGLDEFKAVRQSAGTLLYRETTGELEVLLVHPSGAYNRKSPWSIPKGEPGEDADLEATARRETLEETGVAGAAPIFPGPARHTTDPKRTFCFAGSAPAAAEPRPASWEVDQARFVPLEEARGLLHPDQQVFLDRLIGQLKRG